MIYHSTTHLCPAGTIDDTILAADKKLAQADNLTTSHKNLITLLWLNKINPKLIGIVKLEYTKDLKSGMPLCSLARTIADNVDSLLMRFADHKIQSVASTAPDAEQTQSQVLRFQNQPRFPGPRNNFRVRGQASYSQSFRPSYRIIYLLFKITYPSPGLENQQFQQGHTL